MSIILTQTDTTVGFLSQDSQKLYEIKSRVNSKPFIKVYSNFKAFLKSGRRVPNSKKAFIRRATKTTFIVKNSAFRIASFKLDSQLLKEQVWHYSTSANESGKKFSREFCENKATIIIENQNGFNENSSSNLYKINNIKMHKLRWVSLFKPY